MAFRRNRDASDGWREVTPKVPSPPKTDYFRLGGIRLYQTDDELSARLARGVDELAAYCKQLERVGTEYFGRLGRDFGSLGVLIVVGVKPDGHTKLWCDAVDGAIPDDVWEPFIALLADTDGWPQVTAPVVFALECLIGAGPSVEFPMAPKGWTDATVEDGRGLSIPDDLFEVVFPD